MVIGFATSGIYDLRRAEASTGFLGSMPLALRLYIGWIVSVLVAIGRIYLFAQMQTQSPTSSLGEYKIGKTIGMGAFSKVKLAIHNETGQKVVSHSILI